MRIVVTGATGNIGTSVVEALAAGPTVEQIVGVARRKPEWSVPKVTFEPVDIRSETMDEVLAGADVLVHLAWAFQPTHEPQVTWDVNVVGAMRVFEAAQRARVGSIVYASSVGAYAPGAGRRVDESWPTHSLPVAAYGREKSYLERYLDTFELRNPDVRVVRMRPAFAFKRESASEQRRIFAGQLVPSALFRPGRLPVVPVPRGLELQAVHTDDLAMAFRAAVASDVRGAFNIAADPVIDAGVLGEVMQARIVSVPRSAAELVVGTAWRLRLVPADEGLLRLALSLPTMDAGRARRELGWQPVWSSTEALHAMLDAAASGAGAPTEPLQGQR